jgi:hypothetical protein
MNLRVTKREVNVQGANKWKQKPGRVRVKWKLLTFAEISCTPGWLAERFGSIHNHMNNSVVREVSTDSIHRFQSATIIMRLKKSMWVSQCNVTWTLFLPVFSRPSRDDIHRQRCRRRESVWLITFCLQRHSELQYTEATWWESLSHTDSITFLWKLKQSQQYAIRFQIWCIE